MRIRLIFTLLLCLAINASAQNTPSIDFTIRNLGVNVDGHFDTFSITTKFDASGQLKKLEGEIKVKSIKTGIESRDEHLLEEEYFHTSKFPFIKLKSTSIRKVSSSEYKIKANLTIKGKTKQITIPVKYENLETQRKLSSNFEINRRDFNVGGGSFIMSKTVKLKVIHIEKKQ
ncbi:YceI family protein [uncultured Winogradskyella sp.]|uniref:YceI family protein n=1 Tax=uncultured Winogradskyella sp. TaxID=395353 RepID=UPI00261B5463|nr:YceI family protein [uncultured Winogradskyella sp.]